MPQKIIVFEEKQVIFGQFFKAFSIQAVLVPYHLEVGFRV